MAPARPSPRSSPAQPRAPRDTRAGWGRPGPVTPHGRGAARRPGPGAAVGVGQHPRLFPPLRLKEPQCWGSVAPCPAPPAPFILLSTVACTSSVGGARSCRSVQGCGELDVEPSNHRGWKAPLRSPSPAISPVLLL